MFVRHPVWMRRLGAPSAEAFALLFAMESFARALLTTVIPLDVLAIVGTSDKVSGLYFLVGLLGLAANLGMPWLVRRTARRYVYSAGGVCALASCFMLFWGHLETQLVGMGLRVLGVVALTVCANLYIMDNIPRQGLSRSEPLRIFYSAGAWTLGPLLGVVLQAHVAHWLPYALSAATINIMLGYFWFLRLTDSPQLTRPRGSVASPLKNLARFTAQPRLVLAWTIAVGRSSWWVLFFIYTPIFAVESGLGPLAGGAMVSGGTAFLFLLPLFSRYLRAVGIRRVLINGFLGTAASTAGVALFAGPAPLIAAGVLMIAALIAVSMDAVGNTPFMLAVRPHERPEMTSVYSTYRDFSELGPPGLFAVLLRGLDLAAVYVVGGVAMLLMVSACRRMHPRLGRARPAARAARVDPLPG